MKCPICGQDVPGTVAICWPHSPVVVISDYDYLVNEPANEKETNQQAGEGISGRKVP